MASQTDTVNKTDKPIVLNDNSFSSTKVSSKEPTLKFNMVEYRELKRLETVGDDIAIQNLKKKVRQRMELELASGSIATSTVVDNKTKQVRSATSAVDDKFLVKNDKKTIVKYKRPETTVPSFKNGNKVSNENKNVKSEKQISTTALSKPNRNLTINKEKNKEKPKSFTSASIITNGNITPNKVKTAVAIRQVKPTSLTSVSKSTNGDNKGKQTAINKEKIGTNSSGMNGVKSSTRLEPFIEQWKLHREKGDKYKPLESFLSSDILKDKDRMITVEKIAKKFELERLRRLLEKDKERPNGDKRIAQKRIENINNFGEHYTRLEIAAVRNERGPKKDQQIRAYIVFLNERNIIKNKRVTALDVIEDPNYLKKGIEQFQEIKQSKEKSLLQRKEIEKQIDLERKRKTGGTWQKHKHQQILKLERKCEGNLTKQRRHQESVTETKRRQEEYEEEKERARKQKLLTKPEVQRQHNRIENLRSRRSNDPKKIETNRSEPSKSISLKKRTFDEHSEVTPSRALKRRNVGGSDLDICRLDEATVNRNLSSIIHSIIRPGRQPIYGIVDDNDDDAMEVSGYEVLREEARSSRIARKEDEDEERAEHQRRIKKLNRKKVQKNAIR